LLLLSTAPDAVGSVKVVPRRAPLVAMTCSSSIGEKDSFDFSLFDVVGFAVTCGREFAMQR
jgi:hypothetical protein